MQKIPKPRTLKTKPILEVKMKRWMKNWNFTTISGVSKDECIRHLQSFLEFVDSGVLKLEIDGPLGLAGEMPNGKTVRTQQIKTVERVRIFRGPINGLMIIAWDLKRVREIYRITTVDHRVYYVRLCDSRPEMIATLNRVFEMMDKDHRKEDSDDNVGIITIDGFVSRL